MKHQEIFDDQEREALRWGGLAGMLGSGLLVGVFGFLAALGFSETLDAQGAIERFPQAKTARIVENTFYLLAVALWAFHTVVLFLALKRTRFAPALFGSAMMIIGLVILATGAVPHTATAPISDLYHAANASPESTSTLIVAWVVVQGLVDALVVTGLVLTPIGMGFLGLAMIGNAAYGKTLGGISLLLALAGMIAAVLILINPNDIAAVGIFALVFFHLIIGFRTFRLSEKHH